MRHTLGQSIPYSSSYKIIAFGTPTDFKREFLIYPCSCGASLVAQLVKNLSAVWETWVRSLGWEDPLEKGKATYSSILVWRIPWIV